MSTTAHSRPRLQRNRNRAGTLPIVQPSAESKTKRPAAGGTLTLGDAVKILGVSLAAARERHGRLTERQRQVAALMAKGKPNRQIAEQLGISPKTLDIHRADVMEKLEAQTVAQVANLENLLRLAQAAEG
jgi:two-component system, LuxR family, response regulator FixJ